MNKKNLTEEDVQRGKRLKSVREMNDLTQENLAELFDVSLSMVKKLERGENNITIQELKCLHDEYHVSSDFLLFGEVRDESHFEYQFESFSAEEKTLVLLKMLFHLCGDDRKIFESYIEKTIKTIEKKK